MIAARETLEYFRLFTIFLFCVSPIFGVISWIIWHARAYSTIKCKIFVYILDHSHVNFYCTVFYYSETKSAEKNIIIMSNWVVGICVLGFVILFFLWYIDTFSLSPRICLKNTLTQSGRTNNIISCKEMVKNWEHSSKKFVIVLKFMRVNHVISLNFNTETFSSIFALTLLCSCYHNFMWMTVGNILTHWIFIIFCRLEGLH